MYSLASQRDQRRDAGPGSGEKNCIDVYRLLYLREIHNVCQRAREANPVSGIGDRLGETAV